MNDINKNFDNLQEKIDRLDANPLFQLSLGSKELFHSNLLAWVIGQKYQQKFVVEFLNALLINDSIESVTEYPEREKMNIDLRFTVKLKDDNEKIIIIENKVKSLPYRKQLEEYKEKVTKVQKNGCKPSFYLLSLVEPSKDVVPDEWKLIRYDKVAKAITENLGKIESEDTSFISLRCLLNTYCDYISQLHDIAEARLKITKPEDEYFYPIKTRNDFEKVRLHDLYLKYRYQQVKDFIKESIEKQRLTIVKKKEDLKEVESNPLVMLSSGFSKSNGKIDFKYLSSYNDRGVNIAFCLQLHGNQLRFALEYILNKDISHALSEELHKYAHELFNTKKWMRMPTGIGLKGCLSFDGEPLGKARSSSKYDEERFFCKFGSAFLYKYYKIPDEVKVQDVVQLFTAVCTYLDNENLLNALK